MSKASVLAIITLLQFLSTTAVILNGNGYEGVAVYIADTISENELSLAVVKVCLLSI